MGRCRYAAGCLRSAGIAPAQREAGNQSVGAAMVAFLCGCLHPLLPVLSKHVKTKCRVLQSQVSVTLVGRLPRDRLVTYCFRSKTWLQILERNTGECMRDG